MTKSLDDKLSEDKIQEVNLYINNYKYLDMVKVLTCQSWKQ